jgi:glycosyltransferase involved in cell wall biosynthesis
LETSLPRILVLIEYYLPGYKSGGPVRTVANMVDHLSDHFSFWIVTRDHDFLDQAPYPGIEVGAWNSVGRAMVYYAPDGTLTRRALGRLVAEVRPEVIYLNSHFSPMTRRFLAGRRLGMLRGVSVILAPRGEFSPGALGLKRLKKRLYNALAPRLGLYDGLVWQASSSMEEGEIRACLGEKIRVHVAPDLTAAGLHGEAACPGGKIRVHVAPDLLRRSTGAEGLPPRPPKCPGAARLVFLSRISPKKNLRFAVEVLEGIRGDVDLDIFGPVDSEPYWRSCQAAFAALPPNIRVNYRGSIPHERVIEALASYDLMILPTLGENFGHVIYESFAAGCPVLVSDRTPWRGLAGRGTGWDLALDDPVRWRLAVQDCVDRDDASRRTASAACLSYARKWVGSSHLLESNLALFHGALSRRATAGPAGRGAGG